MNRRAAEVRIRRSILDMPLAWLPIGPRIPNRVPARTVAELLAYSPDALESLRGVGPTTVKQARLVLEPVLGCTWEEACRQGWLPNAHDQSNRRGAEVRIPQRILDMPLASLPIGARIRNRVPARTVGELLAYSPDDLVSLRGAGRPTVKRTRHVLEPLLGCTWELACQPRRLPKPHDDSADVVPIGSACLRVEEYADFLAWWRARCGLLSEQQAEVVRQRSGLDGSPKTLTAIGQSLGCTRQYASFVELQGLAKLATDAPVLGARIQSHLRRGARRLGDVIGDDPWFAPAAKAPGTFAYVLKALLGSSAHLIELEGALWVTPVSLREIDRAWRRLWRGVKRETWPVRQADLDAALDGPASELGPGIRKVFARRLAERLVAPAPDSTVRFRTTRLGRIEAFMVAERGPVRLAAIEARFGHGALPAEAVTFGPGVVIHRQHLARFDWWAPQLAARCATWMRQHGPSREWSCHELVEALHTSGAPVPHWLGPWTLGGVLRRSELLRSLGRLVVALPERRRRRLSAVDALTRAMRAARGPVTKEQLLRRLSAERHVSPFTMSHALERPPFVRVGPGRWGLLERDVPGAPAAVEAAAAMLGALSRKRGKGPLGDDEALELLRRTDEVYELWTPEMVSTIMRYDSMAR